MKSKSAKAVLISIIVSLVIVITASLVLVLWALPNGIVESMALSRFLTALIPILGVSLVMAISSLWIKASKKKKEEPFDEDVLKDPSTYDAPLYGDLDADEYVSPFKIKSLPPEDWDYIEEFEGLPQKQKDRILKSMKKPIERPSVNTELPGNYPFTESFDFFNVPFTAFAFDAPEVPKQTQYKKEEKQEVLPVLEEFPPIEFKEETLYDSPLSFTRAFDNSYTESKYSDNATIVAKRNDFKLNRPIYRLTAAESSINFVWYKDQKEREKSEEYIAPSALWKMIGEFLVKLKPITIKEKKGTIAPTITAIKNDADIEKEKNLALADTSSDAYSLLSYPEDVKENPYEDEETIREENEKSIAKKYEPTSTVKEDATTIEAFSSLMECSSPLYKNTIANESIHNTEEKQTYNSNKESVEDSHRNEPFGTSTLPHLEVTDGVYDLSYHDEDEFESEETVYYYDHSKKNETKYEEQEKTSIPAKESSDNAFSLEDKGDEEILQDSYTIRYTENEQKLPPFTSFTFEIDTPSVSKEITRKEESSIAVKEKTEVALKEFGPIVIKDETPIAIKESTPITPYEKGEIALKEKNEIQSVKEPFTSFEFDIDSSAINSSSSNNTSYNNDLLEAFNIMKHSEEISETEISSIAEDTLDSENSESVVKYIPNATISENPTMDEAYNAFMKCGVFTNFEFEVPSLPSRENETQQENKSERKVYDIPEGNEGVASSFSSLPLPEEMYDREPLTEAEGCIDFVWNKDTAVRLPEEEYIAPTDEEIEKGEFAAKLSPVDASKVKENPNEMFDSLYTPSEMYDKVLSLKHRESYDALPLPEKMPLTRARSVVPFVLYEDKGEKTLEEEYIAPTSEDIERGEFVMPLSPVDISKLPQIETDEDVIEITTDDEPNNEPIVEEIEVVEEENEDNSDEETLEETTSPLTDEFDSLYTPSEMYDKVLSLKHRESYDALPLPEKMPLTRARSVVPFVLYEDKGEKTLEEEYIAPTSEDIERGEFVMPLSPVDISKLPQIETDEDVIEITTDEEEPTNAQEIEDEVVVEEVPEYNEEVQEETPTEEVPTSDENETPHTFIEDFNEILEIEMSEARKFDYELTIARIISEKADDIAKLDIEAMAFMEDEDKLCIIFPCQTKQEATELIKLIKAAVGDKNMKVRIAELRKRGITAAVFSLEIFR